MSRPRPNRRPSPPGRVVVAPVMDDLSADLPAAVDSPAPLLPLLTLSEAQDMVEVLAAVVDGGEVDEQMAYCLLSNLAARVPSRE